MDISINEAMKQLKKLDSELKSVLRNFGEYCDNVTFDSNDSDENFMHDQFYIIVDKLDAVHKNIAYLSKPVTDQGFIKHNSLKRYELPSGHYFQSGSVCEILVSSRGTQKWIYTSIEHNGEDYYATALGQDTSINGMMVRARR